MKALATIALVGLAYGSEDNEFFKTNNHAHQLKNHTNFRPTVIAPHGPVHKNITHKPVVHKNITHKPVPIKPVHKPVPIRKPISKNHTQIPHVQPYKNHTQIPHKNVTHVPHKNTPKGIHHPNLRNITHFPHHKNTTQKPYHPIHKNITAKKPVSADDDDEFFLFNKKNMTNADIKADIMADDDELFLWGRRNVTHGFEGLMDGLRGRNITHAPHYNRTRPFFHLNHNRTLPHKLTAYEDEELYVSHDRFGNSRPKKPVQADDAEDNELLYLVQNGGGRVRALAAAEEDNELMIMVHHGGGRARALASAEEDDEFMIMVQNGNGRARALAAADFEDNTLFDLQKLLADASKTVGDVKQKPRNYGELLNDAINIVKDIKKKDD